jgi:hypothetical protein
LLNKANEPGIATKFAPEAFCKEMTGAIDVAFKRIPTTRRFPVVEEKTLVEIVDKEVSVALVAKFTTLRAIGYPLIKI